MMSLKMPIFTKPISSGGCVLILFAVIDPVSHTWELNLGTGLEQEASGRKENEHFSLHVVYMHREHEQKIPASFEEQMQWNVNCLCPFPFSN